MTLSGLAPDVEEMSSDIREKGISYAIQMWAARGVSDNKIIPSTTATLISDADAIAEYIASGKKNYATGPGLSEELPIVPDEKD